ncbi:MAG TPA: substrate-binding domain-containing protein, partial [Candidatus Binatia bacterium]|nr:substrate-binding domain-containing protein [Candidatus Binatia bacterium]
MAATAPVDPLLTTIEVAALLRVHPKHVYRLLRRGLPGRRVGSEWRFARGEVMQWAARNGRVGADEHAAEEATAPAPGPAAPALVAANGDVVVEILLALAQERGEPLVGFVSADMKRALEMLGRRAVLAAGCHAGGFPTHLGGERLARIHLVTREVGLVHPSGTPPPTLRKLGRLRFASRPPSAGVRRHLDAALAAEGIDAATAHRSAVFLGSHADVVCAVASGHAAVGLAS